MAEKIDDDCEIGVPERWVVSPEGSTVEVLILDEATGWRDLTRCGECGGLQVRPAGNAKLCYLGDWEKIRRDAREAVLVNVDGSPVSALR